MIVVLDTNAIIGASIFSGGSSQIEHELYQQVKHIITQLKSNELYLLKTVRDETRKVLAKAVNDEIDESGEEFDVAAQSEILTTCIKNAESIMSKMRVSNALPTDQDVQEVEQMCSHLVRRFHSRYESIQKRQLAAQRKTDQVYAGRRNWPLKRIACSAYYAQISLESKQIKQFARNEDKGSNSEDKKILAECMALKNAKPGKFYICSDDRRFFSPLYKGERQSRIVTDEILERFGIRCYAPKDFLAKLQSESDN